MKYRLGENLKGRLRAYFTLSLKSAYSDSYVNELDAESGREVEVERVWRGPTGLPYAYNVKLPNGKLYHVSALFVKEIEEAVT